MRKTVIVLLLNLFCLPLAMGHNVQGETGTQSRPNSTQRDIKLDHAVSERYRKIMELLQPEAKRKLTIASRALLREMEKSSELANLERVARAKVGKQFVGLSAAQLDILSFYVLADVAQYEKELLDGKDISQEQQLKMQMIMDRMTKAESAASNLLKKLSDTMDQIIANLK